MTEPDQEEAAARMRAAIAYAGMGQQPVMKALSVSRAGLGRLLHTRGMDRKTITWPDLWKVAEVCNLPHEWFTADFARLAEIVPPGQPTFTLGAADRGVEPRGSLAHLHLVDPPSPPHLPEGGSAPGTDDPSDSA